MSNVVPCALFDALEFLENTEPLLEYYTVFHSTDFIKAKKFLLSYRGSRGTFNSYRREIERLLQWTWLIAKRQLPDLRREDIEAFIRFCQRPSKLWIGYKKVPRFLEKSAIRIPNPAWRPFVITQTKAAHRRGKSLDIQKFELSSGSIKEIFAILSTFYHYLLQEEYVSLNPVALIRQKSQFMRRYQGPPKIRRLSQLQWEFVITTARDLAEKDPERHERTLFMMTLLYALYLRISELVATERWTPKMNDFQRDQQECWWFTTVGKGNKQRQIAVSDALLAALQRWRRHLGLSALPSPADNTSLLPKQRNQGPITSTTYVREIVQYCFDRAIIALRQEGHPEEADTLMEATVHWLRHTGISEDVKHRPREHVRDDAGHGSGAITDRYIDIELHERHRSAKDKVL